MPVCTGLPPCTDETGKKGKEMKYYMMTILISPSGKKFTTIAEISRESFVSAYCTFICEMEVEEYKIGTAIGIKINFSPSLTINYFAIY